MPTKFVADSDAFVTQLTPKIEVVEDGQAVLLYVEARPPTFGRQNILTLRLDGTITLYKLFDPVLKRAMGVPDDAYVRIKHLPWPSEHPAASALSEERPCRSSASPGSSGSTRGPRPTASQ